MEDLLSSYCKFSEMDKAWVSCLSSNIVCSVEWYVDSGALRFMTYIFQEQEGGISVELGDDVTYLVR